MADRFPIEKRTTRSRARATGEKLIPYTVPIPKLNRKKSGTRMADSEQGAVGGNPTPQGEGRPGTDPPRESKFPTSTPRSRSAPTFDENLDIRANTDRNVDYGLVATEGNYPQSELESIPSSEEEEEVEVTMRRTDPPTSTDTVQTTYRDLEGREIQYPFQPPAFQPIPPVDTGARLKLRPVNPPAPQERVQTVEETERLRREQILLQRAREDKREREEEIRNVGTPRGTVRQRGSARYLDTDIDDDRELGLHQMLKHVAKPVSNLNEPTTRDDERYLQRNREHLAKITPNNVRRALQQSLQPTEVSLKEFTRNTVREVRREYEREIAAMRNEMQQREDTFAARLQRLEENEKLSSRVSTEKKDKVVINPFYPSIRADEDLVRKAGLVLSSQIKIVETKITFDKDPFNFLFHLCLESNKVAATHNLTKDQQRDLILNHIPSSEPEYAYINREPTLQGIFSVVSTMASKIMTIAEIQKQINLWSINLSSDVALYRSITVLVDLVGRASSDSHGHDPGDAEVFRQVITRIQRDQIPEALREQLNLARCRIRGNETFPELNDNLLGTLNKFIGYKRKNQSSVPQTNKIQESGPPQVFAVESQPAKPNQNSSTPPHSNQKPKGNWGNKNREGGNGNGNANGGQQKPRFGNKPKGNGRFVAPWDPTVPYLSKNGNTLSNKCQQHFEGYCWKCGHSSHTYDKCRIYTEQPTVLTLCSVCNQGFHDKCRRRYVNPKGKSLSDEVKQLQVMVQQLALAGPPRAFMVTHQPTGNRANHDNDD